MVRHCTLGEQLKQYRVAAGLTQERLAERANLSVRGLSNLERGLNTSPRRETLDRLMEALGLSPAERSLLRVVALPVSQSAPTPAVPAVEHRPLGLVGRRALQARLERHLAGEGPPLLLLAGEPGIGKTRLLEEVIRMAPARGYVVLAGGDRPRREREPYAPILEALRRHLRDQPPATLRAALEGCAQLIHLLPELTGGPIPPLPRHTATPGQRRGLAFAAVARFLANVAGPAGTVLVLDDLHHAGGRTRALLAMLLREAISSASTVDAVPARPLPLRVVGAYRDTAVNGAAGLRALLADLAHAGLVAHQAIDGLPPDEAADLLDGLLGGAGGVDRALRDHILQQADGVPFYLVSYARHALANDQDAVVRPPWDVQQSVLQRLATLSPVARDLLTILAVHDGHVSRRLLLATAGSRAVACAALSEACRSRLLTEDGADCYRFAHGAIGAVLDATIGAAQRALLHERVAQALERECGGDPDAQVVELLAYHYGRSDNAQRAAYYLERSGDHARGQDAHGDARQRYQAAILHLERLGRASDTATVRRKLTQLSIDAARRLETEADRHGEFGTPTLGRI